MHTFFKTLVPNLLVVFSRRYLPLHIVAIVFTLILVFSGFDWKYFLATEYLYPYFFWTALVGGLLPILLPLGLLVVGHLQKKDTVILTAWVLAQAAALGWIVSSLYKVFTGRIQPNLGDYAVDISHQFQFGFLRHGIFWGWPSSHTTVAFAMAFAFYYLYPRRRLASSVWLIYAFLIGLGVSMSIHWLSDAVAGVLIGYVCGRVVGERFRLAQVSSKSEA